MKKMIVSACFFLPVMGMPWILHFPYPPVGFLMMLWLRIQPGLP